MSSIVNIWKGDYVDAKDAIRSYIVPHNSLSYMLNMGKLLIHVMCIFITFLPHILQCYT